ncbi:MAG: hypothetical protein V4543_14165 [Bacteroidota bacterium]
MPNVATKDIDISPTIRMAIQSVPMQEIDDLLRSAFPGVFQKKTKKAGRPPFQQFLDMPVFEPRMSSEQALRETREESTDWCWRS